MFVCVFTCVRYILYAYELRKSTVLCNGPFSFVRSSLRYCTEIYGCPASRSGMGGWDEESSGSYLIWRPWMCVCSREKSSGRKKKHLFAPHASCTHAHSEAHGTAQLRAITIVKDLVPGANKKKNIALPRAHQTPCLYADFAALYMIRYYPGANTDMS